MPLTLLAPAFLLGLLALAVPILIHLFRREKSSIVAFPSLMFLQRIPYRSIRRQRIRHWLLLLLRCAVLAVLVLAFARPLLQGSGVGAAGLGGRRELVVLLDHSYSMGYGDRWPRAVAAARRAVANLGPEDRATVVLFSDRAVATDQPTSDRLRLEAILDGAGLSSRGTRYAPALKLARKLLLDSDRPRREVLLLSDLQKVGWTGEDEIRLPAGTEFDYEDLSDPEASSLSVTSVLLERRMVSGRERITVSARLINKGEATFDELGLALELNDRSLQVKQASLKANDSILVTFDPVTVPAGTSRGTVRAATGADALEADNAFHFVLSPASRFAVLVLQGSGRRSTSSLYLRRALELGEEPSFAIGTRDASRFVASDLEGKRVVVLNDVLVQNASSLRRFVESGGGLFISLGGAVLRPGARPQAADVLSLPKSTPRDRSDDWGGSLAYLDYSHPVFELFSSPRSGDFFGVKFFRYHELEVGEDARVLARFDDARPALVEYALGQGKVLVWPSGLGNFWNDLAVQPVFLPLVHQIVRYLGGYSAPREWYTVGQVADLAQQSPMGTSAKPPDEVESAPGAGLGADDATTQRWVVLAPSGEKRVEAMAESPLFPLEEQGFYELQPTADEGIEAGAEPITLAANLDFAESDLVAMDGEELRSAVTEGESGSGSAVTLEETPAEREKRQRVWWYLLLSVCLLLVAETAFANRLSRRSRATGQAA